MKATKVLNDRWIDKEDMPYMYSEILCRCKKTLIREIHCNVDGIEEYHTKQNKSVGEQVVPEDPTHLWITERQKKRFLF